ncbi:uncharacterized protein SPSK_02526 [Sporothrix schenckii 1099-18]|uniref:Rhodopsin domain-containing protein n=2 Tax=Sporothrix schenckii TaxID=29908 RepID=U7PP16_SPOS1|nr:uncharacterized protein SPSK_02526 [Sporothrix schenckii 1099-18]ERS97337.1 hypothetical protein HMPREF1624_06669 [Sporothrix schenckii ATCC 58251]KJR86709.1 hypothetical protein SPSK_02526 [Sporothrix schenckii 1099-18]
MGISSGEQYNHNLTLGVVTTCLILSFFSFVFRLFARTRSAAKLWYDDYWMCFVMVLCFAMSAGDYTGLAFGSGQHQADLPVEEFTSFLKNLYAYMILWACGVFSVKVGILLFYWRVFPTQSFRIGVVCVACLSTGIFLGNFFSFALQCLPVSLFWDETVKGKCINQNAFYLASAIINVIGDVAVLFLPIPVVWGLHTSRSKKLSLSFLFLLGAFVCVASIFRILAVKEIDPTDFTYSNVAGGLWSTVEVEIGFICANLPALRPLLARWFGRGGGGSSGGDSGYGAYGSGGRGTGTGGGAGASGYGMHSKISASRSGRMPLGSKNGDRDVELMSQGNGSDEINLTKGGRPGTSGSDGMGSDSNTNTNLSHGPNQVHGGVAQHVTASHGVDSGGYGGNGIRVKTEVKMTVDEWSKPVDKKRGNAFATAV